MSNDDRGDERVVTYEVSADESLSDGIVEAISTLSGAARVPDGAADPGSGDVLEPLYSVVDPEALDSIFRTDGPDGGHTEGRVSFPYHGHEVTVHSDGRIAVEPADRLSPSPAD